MSNLTEVILFAVKAHGNQMYNKDMPYFYHLAMVANKVMEGEPDSNLFLAKVAYLHDVLEDTDVEYEDLIHNFGLFIAEQVLCLTKKSEETYYQYIQRVKQNEIAKRVKIADIECNLEECLGNKRFFKTLIERYTKALEILRA